MFPQHPFSLFLPLQWMFLQLNTLWDGPIKQLLADADAWLCKRRTGTTGLDLVSLGVFVFVLLKRLCPTDLCEKEPFLDTEDGLPFRSVFKHVRLQYIINDLASARILERDNILPPGKNENDKTSFFFLVLFLGEVVIMLHLLIVFVCIFIYIIAFQIG